MRDENKINLIHDALNMLDDELILETDEVRKNTENTTIKQGSILKSSTENKRKHKKFGKTWHRLTALAASAAVFLIVGFVWNEVKVPNDTYMQEGIVEEQAVEDIEDSFENELKNDAITESMMMQQSQAQIHLPNQEIEDIQEKLEIDELRKIKEVDDFHSFVEACVQVIQLLYEEVAGGVKDDY